MHYQFDTVAKDQLLSAIVAELVFHFSCQPFKLGPIIYTTLSQIAESLIKISEDLPSSQIHAYFDHAALNK